MSTSFQYGVWIIKCNNLYIILISIIVITAGIVLVVLLYLLNLTVTNGTINGIIFYANVVSINDSVFLVNGNAKQKHLGCKKVRGQSEATLQTDRRDQKV